MSSTNAQPAGEGLTRREALSAGAAALGSAFLGRGLSAQQDNHGENGNWPNILFLLVDELRSDCIGPAGNVDVQTPHLDALASDGVHYENSFCPYPICTPSRYSLLSGLYVHEHRGWSNYCTPAPGTVLFPMLLRRAGYRSKAIGKMHFTPTYLDVGFDEMELAEQNGPGRWDDDYHRYLRDRGLVDFNDLEDQTREYRIDARPFYWETYGALRSNLAEEHHSTTWVGERAVRALEGWTRSANLLMASFIKPHHPFDPPAPWDAMYDPEKITIQPGWTEKCLPHDLAFRRGTFPNDTLTEPALKRCLAYYYATISQIDYHLGRMVETLKRKGLYDDTLIIYTSDHGDYMGFHHMILKGNHMYDPVAKVPLVVKFPGGHWKGTVSQALVNNVDLAPTVLRQAGIQPPVRMRGKDLATDTAGHDIIFAESGRSQVIARTRTHKLIIRNPEEKSLFFNLEDDPLEMTNLYGQPGQREKVGKLKEAIAGWRGPGPLSTVYVNEEAPCINQPNVPPRTGNHREEMEDYSERAMVAIQLSDVQPIQTELGGTVFADTAVVAGETITNSIGMKLKLIQPGTFTMGSKNGEPDETPVHEVTITKEFYIGVYEVTQAEWEAVMGRVPSAFSGRRRPVVHVSWNDVQGFIEKLSEKENKIYRLPTEAQWEYTCKAGTQTAYYWGNGWDGRYGWCAANSGGETHNVGAQKPNAWGLYDMIGNVYEWCRDWFGEYHSASVTTDPQGPSAGQSRVLRGGSFRRTPQFCRSANRGSIAPADRENDYGLRVVRIV